MKKIINKFVIICAAILFISSAQAGDNRQTSFITGVGSTHFEAHRMAYNAAMMSRATVHQQLSRLSDDGLWHVVLKVSVK